MKISTGKIGKYLKELSVVVVGIAITFTISNWISSRNEKKDVKLYLNAVKLELEANMEKIESQIEVLEYLGGYSRYLLSHDKKSLEPDSLIYDGIGTVKTTIYRDYAFEMFKTSGTMRLIGDKEMLESIWKAYASLEELKDILDSYYEIKKNECLKENQLIMDGKPSGLPDLYNFYTNYADFGAVEESKRILQELKETVSKVNIK